MEEMVALVIGVVVLLLGFPVGNYLAKITKEELKGGQVWFRLIIAVSLLIGFYGLLVGKDFVLFSGFFVALVTSRSLRKKKELIF